MSLLQKQLAAHRQKHGLPENPIGRRKPPPSILFSPQEAQWHDGAAFAALARHGIAEASALDPDIAASAALFEGPGRDRETLTKEQNAELDRDIRQLLRLLSPHLLTRGAQECIDGLLHRYHAHRWNVDDLLACALPYHDSPLFTRLLQALQIEGKPQWAWLQPLKDKPATLIRSTLAKYCGKDFSVLTFVGGIVQETVKLHKSNRALSTFFVSVWLDTLAAVQSVSPDLVEAALPAVLAALRRPHLRDSFHAALAIVAGLCIKTELEERAHGQLLERAARQLGGEQGPPAAALMALLLQLQAVDDLPERAVHSLAAAGPQALVDVLPPSVDCENLVSAVVEGCLFRAAIGKDDDESQSFQELVNGILADSTLVDSYAAPLALAALQAFCRALHQGPKDDARQRALAVLRAPLAALGRRQPLALGAALRRAADVAAKGGLPTEPLVELLESSPGGGAVASTPGSTGKSSSIMPLMDALTHGSTEARTRAIEKAVKDLKATAGQEDDAPRQRLLGSLVLQTVEDECMEVAAASLGMKMLWSELPQIDAASAVRVLESVLSRRLKDLQGSGSNLKEMFQHVIQDLRTTKLLPLVLQCFAWVYGRKDCQASLRLRIDAALLPLVVLCLVGLDLASDQEQSKLAELRSALLEFCAASEHALLGRVRAARPAAGAGGAGPLSRAAAQAADGPAVLGLCNLAEGKPWPMPTPQDGEDAASLPPLTGIFGGAAAQAAAAALLALAAPAVQASLGASAEAEKLAVRCSEACQCFAWHQSLAKAGEGESLETLRQLLQASLAGLCGLETLHREGAKGGSGPAEGRRRRKSGPSGNAASSTEATGTGALRPAAQGLLRLALERPRTLAAELRSSLSAHLPLLRPALLRLALGPEGAGLPRTGSASRRRGRQSVAQASAASANALLLLRSLLLSETAKDWIPDQSLLVPLAARLAGAEAPEVRAAAFEVLKALEGAGGAAAGCWDSPLAAALREAGVLRPAGEVLPGKVWAMSKEELELGGLSAKMLESTMEQFVAHKAEILQDCSGAAMALSKSLAGKGGAGRAGRAKAAAFWGVGLSMLTQDVESSLLLAIPAVSLLSGLSVPLKAAAEEAVAGLRGAVAAEAPLALQTAAARMLGLARRRLEPSRAAAATEEEAANTFLQEVAMPFCRGLAEFFQGGGKLCSDSVAELAGLLCQTFGLVLAWPAAPGELRAEVASTLFALCAAASTPSASPAADAGEAEDAAVNTLDPTARVLAAADAALTEAPLDAELLRQVLKESPLLRGKQLEAPGACTAAELLCKQVSGLKGDAAGLGCGGGALLTALTELAKEAAARRSRRLEKAGGAEAEGGIRSTVEQLMLAVAAQSEHLSGTLVASKVNRKEPEAATIVSTVCSSIIEVSTTLGKHLTASMLLAIIRACGALAPLVPATDKLLASPHVREQPAPLQCCIQALSCYSQPLRADVLSLLKAHFQSLWRCPELPANVNDPALIMQWDFQAQARLRFLLHNVVLEKKVLIEQVDQGLCLSLAESAGPIASMDFLMLLHLARQGPATAAAPVRRKPKKRRAAERDSLAEEFLAEVPLPLDDDALIDETLGMLTSVAPDARYQCLATLAQALSSLAAGICLPSAQRERGLALAWGPSLLPSAFLQSLDTERAFWVLNIGLQVAGRFLSEHGLPGGLDGAEVEAAALRGTALAAEAGAGAEAAALAVCYVAWAACATEVLLQGAAGGEEPYIKACRDQARHLRSLLMRSLAVNHPVTFFRVICLAVQIPGMCPATAKMDLFADKKFMMSEAQSVMAAAREALQERWGIRGEDEEGRADDEEAQAACAPLCAVAMKHTCECFLAGAAGTWPQDLAVVAWRFLDALCYFGGKSGARPASELCLPAAARCLADFAEGGAGGPGMEVAVESCTYVETAIAELGHGLLECLNVVAKPLLECAAGDESRKTRALEERALATTKLLVKSLGAFLSPFLPGLLALTSGRTAAWKTELLEPLGRELVAGVPGRLLLPAVRESVAAADRHWASLGGELEAAAAEIEGAVVRVQRLAALLSWAFSEAPPEAVAADADAEAGALLRLLGAGGGAAAAWLRAGGDPQEVSARVFYRDLQAKRGGKAGSQPSWTEDCSKPSVLRLNELAATAFAQFSLRLEIDDLKPRFSRVLEWARNSQAHTLEQQSKRKTTAEAKLADDTEDACRLIALCAAMQGLAAEAPGAAEELLLPLATKDLAAGLGASRRCALQLAAQHRPAGKKRRRSGAGGARAGCEALAGHTWWWFEASAAVMDFLAAALRPVTEHSKVVEEAIDALLEPCSNMLDVCEFLPASEESDLTAALLKAIQGALVALAAASDTAHMKRLLTTILLKSRSDDVEVRLCSVHCCHKIWTELGVQAASGLSEVVMYASELLEDEDSRVEAAVRVMIKTMEDCTGESLQDSLKH